MPKMSAGGGPALKEAIHVARARAGIASDLRLATLAGVSYDTLMNWYRGSTTPRPAQVLKVAKALGVPLDSLMAAYEGRALEPDSIEQALRQHTTAVERQNELLTALVAALSRGAASVALALSDEPPSGRTAELAQAAIAAELRESGGVGGRGPGDGDGGDVRPSGRSA